MDDTAQKENDEKLHTNTSKEDTNEDETEKEQALNNEHKHRDIAVPTSISIGGQWSSSGTFQTSQMETSPNNISASDTTQRQTIEEVNNEEETTLDLSCGVGSLRTNVFGKWFSNLYVFAVCVGISSLFTSMISQIISVQLSSLQKQFNINNTQAGLFDTSSRIGFMCTVLFAGHFAKKVHIPVVVGLFGVIQGLLLIVPSIFQFVDPYELETTDSLSSYKNLSNSSHTLSKDVYLCRNASFHQNVTEKEVNRLAYYVIVAVQALKGVTDSFHSGFLPILYIDDNLLDKTKMGIFLGIQLVISEMSGPIGKEINGYLSNIPIDLKATEIESNDERFVAAWWLAFLIFGVGTAVFSFPVLLFPRQLVTNRKQKEALDIAMVTFAGGEVHLEENDTIIEETRIRTARHPSIVVTLPTPDILDDDDDEGFNYLAFQVQHIQHSEDSVEHFGNRRISIFPDVVEETQRRVSISGDLIFHQPVKVNIGPDESATLSTKDLIRDFPKALLRVARKPAFIILLINVAVIAIPIGGVQMFRNEYMTIEYNVKRSEVAFISGLTTAVGNIGGTFLSSWISSRVSTKLGYVWIIIGTYIFMTCISPFYILFGCDNVAVYGDTGKIGIPVNTTPLCECDTVGVLLACGADNNNYKSPCYAGCGGVDGKNYYDCKLLQSNLTTTLTPGLCETDCHSNFLLYVILHGVQYLANSMGNVPIRLLIIRIVNPEDRGFATSIFIFFYMLTSVASPSLFGNILDGTCLIWNHGHCSLYDRNEIRYVLSGIDIGVYSCSMLTLLLVLAVFKWEIRKSKRKERTAQENH